MATAGKTTTLGTSDTTLFDATVGGADVAQGACNIFWVAADSANTVDVMVLVTPLHAATEYFYLAPGKEQPFRAGGVLHGTQAGITKVVAKSVSGTTTVRYGVAAKF